MSSTTRYYFLFLLLHCVFFFTDCPFWAEAHQAAIPTSQITVVGVVFCDFCSANSFSRHSYFLPGADVHIRCQFKAYSPKTAEQMSISVNRTTDRHGVYKLEIPHVDGTDCVEGMAIESLCQASLIGSSSSACNVPGINTATNEISVKSKQDSLCIYSLKALSYKPSKRNVSICGKGKKPLQRNSYDSSKSVLPYYFPRYGFFWPPLQQLTPFPFPSPPSMPFPFRPQPPSPSLFRPPPPPKFNLGDPTTWIPNVPKLAPPPPPPFNPLDPRTWIPNVPGIPILAPPPPPPFNPLDPRTWIPNIPGSPPSSSRSSSGSTESHKP